MLGFFWGLCHWLADGHLLSVLTWPFLCAHTPGVSLYAEIHFLLSAHQSDRIRVHTNSSILTQLPLQRTHLQITVTFWGTVSLELQQTLGGDTIQPIIACKWFTSGISMKDEREQGMVGEPDAVTQTWHQWRRGKRKDWAASSSDCSPVWKVQVRLMVVLQPTLPSRGVPRTAAMRLH